MTGVIRPPSEISICLDQKLDSFFVKRSGNNPEYKTSTNWLRRYLEFYTHLKTEPGKFYSREQARFIFDFLEIHGLIKDAEKISNKEDVIGYYLNSLKKNREKWEKYREKMDKIFGSKEEKD